MAVQTYKELAEIYAARISKCKDGDMRVIELNKIWMEIQTLTVDGKVIPPFLTGQISRIR